MANSSTTGMPERIYKLQPDRTLSLRGFDSFAAAASLHNASPTGFTISGTYRDPADFCVAVLYDADNYYEHPSIRYLPDFDFSNLTLQFDVTYSDGVQPIDSPQFPWIEWSTINVLRPDGTKKYVSLWDNATLQSTAFPAAAATITVQTSAAGIQQYDRLTLWFQNLSYDYLAPLGSAYEIPYFASAPGASHTVTISSSAGSTKTYTFTEVDPKGTSADIVAGLVALVNDGSGDPNVVASIGSTANKLQLAAQANTVGQQINLSASPSENFVPVTITANTPAMVAASLASYINQTDWMQAQTAQAILATSSGADLTMTAARYGQVNVSGNQVTLVPQSGTQFTGLLPGMPIRIGNQTCTIDQVSSPTALTIKETVAAANQVTYVAPRGGRDGNNIRIITRSKSDTLSVNQPVVNLTRGRSDVTWRCSLDFTALGIDQIRQCWLTFAPSLTDGSDYAATEWQAVFSNWSLNGAEDKKKLQFAGKGSQRIEESDSACTYNRAWITYSSLDSGGDFFSGYYARASNTVDDFVTVRYTCQLPHLLYIGTRLYGDYATVGVSLDGGAESDVVCALDTGSPVVTRRLALTAQIPAGSHTVKIRQKTAGIFYFDFLDVVVPGDVPDPLAPRTALSPALDFDTDHTYKLPPARIHWMFDQLGFAGPINEYLGVFWWNERKSANAKVSTWTVDFTGTWSGGDEIDLTFNVDARLKLVLPGPDTPANLAEYFAASINQTLVGARATASGGTLTVLGRSPAAVYNVTVALAINTSSGGLVDVQFKQAGQVSLNWQVDDSAPNPMNRSARDWHADFFQLAAARRREVTTACSMELVVPPDGYSAKFHDGTDVTTATDFGGLLSTQCAIGNSKVIGYQKQAFRAIAQLQKDAGLVPNLQFGEFLWWFFAGSGGTAPNSMAYFDDETKAAVQAALGRELHLFTDPNDDPNVNGGADATFLRNRLRDHVAALCADIRANFPGAQCEVLWPDDVNYQSVEMTKLPPPGGPLGGQLNHFVNLPVEWKQKSTSGLDRVKTEALAFGSNMRNLDLANDAIRLFPGFGWPLDSVRYLVPIFGVATPWIKEAGLAWGAGLQAINLWAFDHICLYNLDVSDKTLDRRSFLLAS